MGSFWAILTPFWPKMALFGLFWAILAILGPRGPNPTLETIKGGQNGPKWPFWAILGHFGPFWAKMAQNDPILGYFLCRYWPRLAKRAKMAQNDPFWAPGPQGPNTLAAANRNMGIIGPK